MTYENPRIPEGINVTRESVPAEFLRLLAGLLLVVVVAALALHLAGGWLARQVPFALERSWVGERLLLPPGIGTDVADAQAQERVQALARELAAGMALPRGMTVDVHLVREDVPNAFATLGGHVLVTEGLYRRLPSENALAMVLAHELAHLRARDPIAAAGGGAALTPLLLALGGDAEALAPQLARLVQLGYSRQAEARADEAAIAALLGHYGHAGGAAGLFEALADYDGAGRELPALLATHPADAARIARLQEAARGWDATRQPLVALPAL